MSIISKSVPGEVFPTSIVSDCEVAAVGPLRSQAKEKLVSCWRLISIDCTHCLDPLSETPTTINMNIPVEVSELRAVSEMEKDWQG